MGVEFERALIGMAVSTLLCSLIEKLIKSGVLSKRDVDEIFQDALHKEVSASQPQIAEIIEDFRDSLVDNDLLD